MRRGRVPFSWQIRTQLIKGRCTKINQNLHFREAPRRRTGHGGGRVARGLEMGLKFGINRYNHVCPQAVSNWRGKTDLLGWTKRTVILTVNVHEAHKSFCLCFPDSSPKLTLLCPVWCMRSCLLQPPSCKSRLAADKHCYSSNLSVAVRASPKSTCRILLQPLPGQGGHAYIYWRTLH